MIKKLLLFVAFVGIGFTLFSYRATILNHLDIITQPLQSTVTKIQTAWTSIPEPYKGYANLAAVGGIPTALMMFFAWAKMQWQKKAQQTQLQASQKISGLNTQMQALVQERDAKIGELTSQLEAAKNTSGLQSSLSEAQNLVAQKQEEINKLQTYYQGQIDALHKQVEELKLKVHETVVVR